MVRSGRARPRILIFLLFLFLALPRGAFAEPKDVVLDADKVIFDSETGRAEAEGDARLRHENIRVFSHRMELDTANEIAYASSKPGDRLTILYGANRFTGETLEYDMKSREGVLTNARGDLPAGTAGGTVFLRGKHLEVAPLDTALEKKWLKKRQTRKVKDEEVQVARWSDVSLTTCPSDRPHYRLQTKRLIVIPGVRVIAKNPRVYIAEKFLFSYPFDYVIPLHKERDALLGIFIPSVVHDSDKGIGYALTGPLAWDTGHLSMAFRYWSDIGLEARAGIVQSVGRNTAVFGNMDYSYEKLDEFDGVKTHRPSWGIASTFGGWSARLLWSQRENLEIFKNFGETYRNVLHREPELTLSGPWWTVRGIPDLSWSVTAVWGEYETARQLPGTVNSSGRFVGDIQAQYIVRTGTIRPFWRGQYRTFSYTQTGPTGQDSQEIMSTWLGFRTRFGSIDFAGAWFLQNVTGESPMSWDRAGDREVLYSEIGFPLGKNVYFSALPAYDVKASRLGEVGYRLVLDHDCSRWELLFRDDQVGEDDWVSLRFMVKAFPETPLVFGDKALTNPFPGQGEFLDMKKEGVPSRRPVDPDAWGKDGLTSRNDPTRPEETKMIPASPETASGDISGENGDLYNP